MSNIGKYFVSYTYRTPKKLGFDHASFDVDSIINIETVEVIEKQIQERYPAGTEIKIINWRLFELA